MSPRTFFVGLAEFGLAAAVLFLSHYRFSWLAAILVLAPSAYHWFRHGRSLESALATAPSAIIGLSVVVLVGLNRPPFGQAVFPVASQVALTILYAAWLVWTRQVRIHGKSSLLATAIQQFMAVSALFLASAFWHWPQVVVIILLWGAVGVSTLWYLRGQGERAATILAATWALIASQIAWVLSSWQVNYIIGDGLIIVPQTAVVILGVGYCFASIYSSHKEKRLSRRRLIECVAVAGVLLAIVIAGTRWNGLA